VVTTEQEIVQLFAVKGRQSEALYRLVGGTAATHLRTVQLDDPTFEALAEGLSDPNPRVRWWCVQVLDHVPDARATGALIAALDDQVPRVRKNAVHALGCIACKPGWSGALPREAVEKLARMATADPSEKVRAEAHRTLACR
jgi:HEAT repeat protein